MKTVSVVGCGEIGSALVRGIGSLDRWQLGQVLTRRPVPGLAGSTTSVDAFLAHPADLMIDAAGPDALRMLGARVLALTPLWSVGAVALADPAFRKQIAAVTEGSGHKLRIFACGMANVPLSADRLRITMRGPEIEEAWAGPLSHAVAKWPNRLNTAVAAALNGPGLDATEVVMECAGPDAPHEIEVDAEADGIVWHRSIRFNERPDAPHPAAQMLLTELARAGHSWAGV